MEKELKRMAWNLVLITLLIATSALGNSAQAFEFRGFGDVNFADAQNKDTAPNTSDSGRIAGFRLGQLSLHAHGDLGENLEATTEIAFTSGSTPAIARLYAAYTFDEMLRVRAGKWHKSIGYWNTTYHHGTLLQTTIEGILIQRIVPIHETGLWALGTYNAEPVRLDYGVSVTNGQGTSAYTSSNTGIAASNDLSDINTGKAFLFHVRAHPSAIPALGIGISANIERIQSFTSAGVPALDIPQQLYAVDLQYINQQIEFLSEYFYFNDKDDLKNTGTFKSAASYVQFGYSMTNHFMPYARYERISVREADPYFKALSSTPDQQKSLAGLRYNMTANSALKGELQLIDPSSPKQDSYKKYAVQWAFAF